MFLYKRYISIFIHSFFHRSEAYMKKNFPENDRREFVGKLHFSTLHFEKLVFHFDIRLREKR